MMIRKVTLQMTMALMMLCGMDMRIVLEMALRMNTRMGLGCP
jgi:hypothetical protein